MNAVAKFEQPETQSVAVLSPMAIMQMAVDKNLDLERIQKLMEIGEQFRKIQAEQAFSEAIAAFKADPPQVVKDALNKQYNSYYATIGNIVNTVNPALGKHGLSASWTLDPANPLAVTCILEHFAGHKRSVTMAGPSDTSGAKNPLQQIRSAQTYLKVATFEAVTGIVANNKDDDGNGAGPQKEVAPAPEGYEKWKADLAAVAEEGSERLMDVWKNSEMSMRSYTVKVHGDWWNTIKNKAKKVQP